MVHILKQGEGQMATKKYLLGSSALVFFLLLCVGIAIVGTLGALIVGWGATMSETQEYNAQDPPTHIVVTNPVGDAEIRPSTNGRFTVRVRKRVRGSWFGDRQTMEQVLGDMDVKVAENNGRLDIQVQRPRTADSLRSASVDVLITVPQQVDIDVTEEVGELHLKGVTGVVRLEVGVGSIMLDNVTLLAGSTVQLETGSIRFSGRLPDQGTVRLATGVGSISIKLPRESAFNVDASTGVGHVKVKFPTKTYDRTEALQLSVGKAPATTLIVKTDTGSINITLK